MNFCQHQLERVKNYCIIHLRPAEVPDPRKLPLCPYSINDLGLLDCEHFKPVDNLDCKLQELEEHSPGKINKQFKESVWLVKSDELTRRIFTDFYGKNKSYIGFMISETTAKEEVHESVKSLISKGLVGVDCYALQRTELGLRVYELFK
ncbi:hypothetical protein GF352_00435 [archaeon]|nr:hypothetical protein [archaeon]